MSKTEEDVSDHEFDNIFNDVCQTPPTKSFWTIPAKKECVTDKKFAQNSLKSKPPNPNPGQQHQGLLVTCTHNVVTARNVQLLSSDEHDTTSKGTTNITAVGQPIIVAEELGEVTCLNLTSNGEWLALALSCLQIWIIQLTWKTVNQAQSNTSSTVCLPKIIKAVRHHATLDGHKAPIHGLHFLKGKMRNLCNSALVFTIAEFKAV